MNKDSMSLADALRSGVSAEDILKDFQNELDAAKKQVAAEQAKAKEQEEKNEELDYIREDLVEVIVEYLNALGLIDDEDMTDEEYDKLNELIKETEKDFKRISRMAEAYKAFEKELDKHKDADAIIKAFVESL